MHPKSCAIRTRTYMKQAAQVEVRNDDLSNCLNSVWKDWLVLIPKDSKWDTNNVGKAINNTEASRLAAR